VTPLGGAPAVWNTCLVFFQAMLLAGYAYAHVSTRLLGVRRQAVLHGGLLLVSACFLPVRIPDSWSQALTTDPNPALRLLACLLVVAGLPLFIVSSTSPLLQRWFSTTGHKAAADPYFLYAAGNLGSLGALLGYPVLLEPHLGLGHQTEAWAAGFGLLAALTAACAIPLWAGQTAGGGG